MRWVGGDKTATNGVIVTMERYDTDLADSQMYGKPGAAGEAVAWSRHPAGVRSASQPAAQANGEER